MSFIVKRMADGRDRTGFPAWTGDEAWNAVKWCDRNYPGSLIANCYMQFHFNNKEAAIMFKLVWG